MYQKNALLTIQEFATICSTTVKTLRVYERLELLTPFEIDKKNNYRYYKQDQTRTFEKIKLLQRFNVPLKEIKELLEKGAEEEFLKSRLRILKSDIQEKEREYSFLTRISALLLGGEDLKKTIRKDSVGPFFLFSYTVEHGQYEKSESYFQKLKNTAKDLGIVGTKKLMFYHDYDFKPSDSTLEFSLLCSQKTFLKKISLPEGFSFREFEKTRSYIYTYQGPYDYLSLVYHKVFVFLENNKVKPNGPVFEMYEAEDEERSEYEQVMEIVFPVDEW